jgi:uncharacterized protein DUF5906
MKPSDFLRLIYKEIPPEAGSCQITVWNRQNNSSLHLAIPGDTQSETAFDSAVDKLVSENKDVYYGVSLRRPNLLKSQRGKVSDVRGLPGLWLDIDFDSSHVQGLTNPHAAKNLPKNEVHAAEILSCYPEPTEIIDSGYGWHVYWLFDIVHPVGYLDQNTLSNASEQWQRKGIAHAAKLGYHVDYTASLDRVLRLPGTNNLKAGLCKPVTCMGLGGPRYGSINALLQAANIDARTSLPSSVVKPSDTEISPELLKPRTEIAPAQDSDWIKDNLTRLHNPESLALMESVLAGKPFAVPGDRDRTLQRVASVIAYLAPDRDPKELAEEILAPSLATFDDVDKGKYTQADRIEWAASKIERAQEDARRDRVIKERHDKALADVLLTQARSAPRRDQRLGQSPEGAYTDAEIAAYATQQGTTPQNFRKRWIIQKGASFYVYVNGDYQLPLAQTELDVSLPRDLAPAVQQGYVKLDCQNAKGEPRTKTTKEILSDYASVARTVITRLDLGFSYYDEATQTFYEASCPIRPLEPAYSPEVAHWLTLLGGQTPDKLLDWVATVTNLDRQSAALYIQGPGGTGKTLLSHGLARLWHQGSPTELVRVLGDWTEDMAKCPLICADEQIPQGHEKRTSAELRSLIGNSGRTLTRKYLSNSSLQGAIRMILSANNADMLVFDEMLSAADLEAVAGRFLHVIPDIAAKTYLESIDTQGWVEDDVIAKHALWLRDNHTVVYGRRFAVEGSAQEVATMLATRGGIAGRVSEWLVRYICDTKGSNVAAQAGLVVIGQGEYLVNTNAVVNFWDNYVKSSKVPSTPQVGSALRNLSRSQERYNGKRYFSINIDAICSWSEANLVGDPDMIAQKIAQPRPALPGVIVSQAQEKDKT